MASSTRRQLFWLMPALLLLGGLRLLPQISDTVAVQAARDRGQASFEEKQYSDAIDSFRSVAESGAATAQDLMNLSLALYKNNDDPAALNYLQQAEQLDSRHPGLPYLRGIIHKRRGDSELALVALQRAAELDPTDPAIRFNLGTVFEQLENPAAEAELEAVIAMGFDIGLQHYVSSLYRRAGALLRAGERDAATDYLTRWRQESPRLSQAAQGQAALEEGRHTRIRVPRLNVAAAIPESAARIRWRVADLQALSTRPARAASGVAAAAGVAVLTGGDGKAVVIALVGDSIRAAGVNGEELDLGLELPGLSEGAQGAGLDGGASVAFAVGDFDDDRLEDLVVVAARSAGDQLYRRGTTPEGQPQDSFERVIAQGLPGGRVASALVWVDADHDGDLDLLSAHTDVASGPGLRLLDNLGGGAFEDVTSVAGLDAPVATRDILWADFDSDNDTDFYAIRSEGANALFTNLRNGRFDDIAVAVGASGPTTTLAAVAEDLDNDGAPDLALAGPHGLTLLRNTGDGTFLPVKAGLKLGALDTILAADLNNDGHLDLVVGGADGPRVLVNQGSWQAADSPPSEFIEPFRATRLELPPDATPLLARDADGNGGVDLLLSRSQDGSLAWYLQEEPVGSWLALSLQGDKNNALGVGSTVEVKGGGLYQLRQLRHSELHFGLGARDSLDVVRITWPNGIIQNEIGPSVPQRLGPVAELERLEGSCPLLYTWDGHQWRFINEVLGVAPLGMPLGNGEVHAADYDEYVPVPAEALKSRDGFLELRFTEELRETGYLDAVRLLALDHPADLQLYPDEKFVAPPHPEFSVYALREPLPVTAIDQRQRDWSAELAAVDESWAVPFERAPYDGLATRHHLELSLPEASGGSEADEQVVLFLTGWVYWATGSSNVAVADDPRYDFEPVSLQVPDGQGGWRVAINDIGIPNAKNSTVVVDLTEHLLRGDPRVRISTTLLLYWDAARYAVGGGAAHLFSDSPTGAGSAGSGWLEAYGVPRPGPVSLLRSDVAGQQPLEARMHALAPLDADLQFRGFSRLLRTTEGYERFDYDTVLAGAPWDQHRGHYTRYGGVGELLQVADDRFVILGTGDEVAIRFEDSLPELPAGWRRDWLVYLNGWVKDGDPNTLHGDRVEPLPFHAMSAYPYGPDELYPDTAEHRAYQLDYNTRPARRINPRLALEDY